VEGLDDVGPDAVRGEQREVRRQPVHEPVLHLPRLAPARERAE